MDTLAFGYVIPAIRAYSGLAPVRQCSCRAYNKKGDYRSNRLFVIPERFERSTHALEGRCSIQLSYGTILNCGAKIGIIFILANFWTVFFIKMDNQQQNARQNYP